MFMTNKNLTLSITMAIATVIMATCTKVLAEFNPGEQHSFPNQGTFISQSFTEEQKFTAFFNSQYSYCDAETLSKYWGMGLDETKMRMGRKILGGDEYVGFLEQYLVDARLEALRFIDENPDQALCYYAENGYSYDDAVLLAAYWGEADSWLAKLRIERNLLLNNGDVVLEAFRMAQRQQRW